MAIRLFRVFSRLSTSSPHQNGGAFYIPPQGLGRLDSPPHYRVLYLCRQPEAAVAEVFAAQPYFEWTAAILRGSKALPGSSRAVAEFEVPHLGNVCDLDDPKQLLDLGLRPSRVITRDYSVTQAWALKIYLNGAKSRRSVRRAGVSWFCYHEGRWTSLGLWDTTQLTLVGESVLTLDSPAVVEAARVLNRRIRS